jgi:hypothetical protein
VALLALSAFLVSCGAKGTAGLSGPQPTLPASSSPAAIPDARSVPVEPLLPEGATVEKVLYGRLLPGEGEQIIVQSSRDIGCDDRQDYLQVFAFDPDFGEWKALFEANRWPSPAAPFIPDRRDFSDHCKRHEVLDLVELVNMEGGGTQDLAVAVSTGKDEPGPLLLKVLSFRAGAAEAIYDETTIRGGAARLLDGDRIALEQGTYPPQSGPLWRGRSSPNGTLTEVIGLDEEYHQVDVLESSVDLYCLHGAVDQVKDDALIVTCDADGLPRFTGFRLTGETRVLPAEFGGPGDLRVGQEVSVSAAEPLELNEDWELEPVAAEIRVLNQRQALAGPPAQASRPPALRQAQDERFSDSAHGEPACRQAGLSNHERATWCVGA